MNQVFALRSAMILHPDRYETECQKQAQHARVGGEDLGVGGGEAGLARDGDAVREKSATDAGTLAVGGDANGHQFKALYRVDADGQDGIDGAIGVGEIYSNEHFGVP